MAQGFLISFEGGDGAGKGTQIEKLKAVLGSRGLDVVYVREPGGTKAGEVIRTILKSRSAEMPLCPRAELLLFMAARAQVIDEVITPALAAGKIVLCDRFMDSSVAYQGHARKLGVKNVDWLNAYATADRKPDLTILLDISVEEGDHRRVGRKGATDRFEESERAFHQAVRDGYLTLAAHEPNRVKVVDAQGDIERIHKDVLHHVEDLLER